MTARFAEVALELARGDIARQPDLDAVVNAANAELAPGGGVAGAIHRAAGPGLYAECRPLAPIRTGHAVITGAYELPNLHVVHTLGPVYAASADQAGELAACYRQSLHVADRTGCRSIGFPAVSAGIFGYPIGEAADVALRAVAEVAPALRSIRLVRFVLFGGDDLAAFERALRALE